MELYKLFCIIHRNTGFDAMYEIQREMMFPEEYAERRKRGEAALHRLGMMHAMIAGLTGGSFYGKRNII